jgi:hypothetical protein
MGHAASHWKGLSTGRRNRIKAPNIANPKLTRPCATMMPACSINPSQSSPPRWRLTKGSLSHHFNVLEAADLVRSERRGQHIVYSLNTTVFQDLSTLLMELFQVDKRKV